jgi:hypothetical protein
LTSLLLYHAFPVLIHNRCSDFELVSPIYFGYDVIWYIPPSQKVDTNTTSRIGFRKNSIKYDFTAALIYRLQRKDRLNVDDTNLRLLIVWRINDSHDFYVNAMLIKQSYTVTWDEDRLKKYLALYKYHRIIEDTWLLDDTTVLSTTSKWGEIGRKAEITISKGMKRDNSIEPLYIP